MTTPRRGLMTLMHRLPRWITHPPGRDVLLAVAVFAVGTGMYLGNFYEMFGPHEHEPPLWVRLLVLAWACVGLSLRHRAVAFGVAIVASAAAVDVALDTSAPVMLVLMDIVHMGTLHGSRRLRQAMMAVVAVVFVVTLAVGALLDDWRQSLLGLLQLFSLLVVPVWWAMNVRQHREMAIAERANARQLARIAELDRRAAVNAERARMARDLHDVVAGHLSAIAIQSEALLSMADGDPEMVRTVLKSVRENSIQSLTEMRAMITVLRSPDEEDDKTAPARLAELDRLVDSARAAGLRVEVDAGRFELPVAVDLAAYRIAQEALTNAIKHAAGARVRVEVSHEDSRLVVAVSNEIMGPGIQHGTGTGLVSMGERAHAVGGTFFAGRVGDEWRVRAELPAEGAGS